jgi:diacylglycerol O-acyltransferase / wax synthase
MLKHVDFLASNVPGFPMQVYLAGARLVAYYPFGPTIGAAVNVTLMSYMDTCFVGINADTGAIPDVGEFMVCLREGFREVLAVGRVKADRIRLPLHQEGGEAPWR